MNISDILYTGDTYLLEWSAISQLLFLLRAQYSMSSALNLGAFLDVEM